MQVTSFVVFALFTVLQYYCRSTQYRTRPFSTAKKSTAVPDQGSSTAAVLVLRYRYCSTCQGLLIGGPGRSG